MKRHQKIIAALAAATAGASVLLQWTVDTSRVDPAVFDVVRGETVELKATFNSYGKPLDMGGKDVSIFWQTNGMGSAWWSAPAAATGNTVTAAFTPAMDPGAASVSGFLGVPGEIYRGAFVLRFRHGPGAVPNELELPRKSIDFATVEVKNAPWEDIKTAADAAKAVADNAAEQASAANAEAKAAMDAVGEVKSILAGEDFRITITNYDSKVRAPELSMGARYSDGTTQTWATVWTETNGLARTKRETLAEVKSNHYGKAESDARYKAWGKYDSETGENAPEGFTQISSPGGLIIGADAGWKNYISASGGSYWIWRGNGNITTSQETGTLEILDADGNAVFSVVKGDKTIESAAAASISSTSDGVSDIVTIVYNVEADEAPVIEWSAELKPAAWYAQTDDNFPGTVVWESENNIKWTATVTLPANGTGFFRATYKKGADSYIRASKAMAIDRITVGGKTYTLGVGEINGTKVLTLK